MYIHQSAAAGASIVQNQYATDSAVPFAFLALTVACACACGSASVCACVSSIEPACEAVWPCVCVSVRPPPSPRPPSTVVRLHLARACAGMK